MDDNHINKLDAVWKGEPCKICGFALDQREFDDIEEAEIGFVHKSCKEDPHEYDTYDKETGEPQT